MHKTQSVSEVINAIDALGVTDRRESIAEIRVTRCCAVTNVRPRIDDARSVPKSFPFDHSLKLIVCPFKKAKIDGFHRPVKDDNYSEIQ